MQVWQLGSNSPNFTLDGHEKGVNCVDYYHGGDKPYLISGADDRMVKIWDYQNKTCVQTLEGHAQVHFLQFRFDLTDWLLDVIIQLELNNHSLESVGVLFMSAEGIGKPIERTMLPIIA